MWYMAYGIWHMVYGICIPHVAGPNKQLGESASRSDWRDTPAAGYCGSSAIAGRASTKSKKMCIVVGW
jgi:hypothetical protein